MMSFQNNLLPLEPTIYVPKNRSRHETNLKPRSPQAHKTKFLTNFWQFLSEQNKINYLT